MTNKSIISTINEVYSGIQSKNNLDINKANIHLSDTSDKILQSELIKKVNSAYFTIISDNEWWSNNEENIDENQATAEVSEIIIEEVSSPSTNIIEEQEVIISEKWNQGFYIKDSKILWIDRSSDHINKLFLLVESDKKLLNLFSEQLISQLNKNNGNIWSIDIVDLTISSIEKLNDSEELVCESIKILQDRKKYQKRLIDDLCRYEWVEKYVLEAFKYVKDESNQYYLIQELCKYDQIEEYVLEAFKYVKDKSNQYYLIQELWKYDQIEKYVLEAFKYVKDKSNQYYLIQELWKYDQIEKYVLEAFKYVKDESNQYYLIQELCKYEWVGKYVLEALKYVEYESNQYYLVQELWKYDHIEEYVLEAFKYVKDKSNQYYLIQELWRYEWASTHVSGLLKYVTDDDNRYYLSNM